MMPGSTETTVSKRACSSCAEGKGGCFPLHYDSDEQVDGRRVTAIFYLNTGWQPSHGGQLQLFPFPEIDPVTIAPIADRLVLFSSCRMLHRSRTFHLPRACVAQCLSGFYVHCNACIVCAVFCIVLRSQVELVIRLITIAKGTKDCCNQHVWYL